MQSQTVATNTSPIVVKARIQDNQAIIDLRSKHYSWITVQQR